MIRFKGRLRELQQLHLRPRFFYALALCVLAFVLAFVWPSIELLAWTALAVWFVLCCLDFMMLFVQPLGLNADRKTSKRFSLGDPNHVVVRMQYKGRLPLLIECTDETPAQLQMRSLNWNVLVSPNDCIELEYDVVPNERGEYHFGHVRVLAMTRWKLIGKALKLGNEQMVPVYPSFIQMKKFEMLAFARISNYEGIKKVRRVGHSYEFEKIRHYAIGDDLRSINWKATGRRNAIMVNQYEDQRSQQVYFVLDKSRVMQMPFNELTLLDYSINSTLVLANIALRKFDKVGLISFAHQLGTVLKCQSNPTQLSKMMQALYAERPQLVESNFETLNYAVGQVIRNRSLLFLFTNFESEYALTRALPNLARINAMHLLVVVLFENSELRGYTKRTPVFVSDIYSQTIAQRLLQDKKSIVARLNKQGIQTVLTTPEELSIHTINKYLELKSKGLI